MKRFLVLLAVPILLLVGCSHTRYTYDQGIAASFELMCEHNGDASTCGCVIKSYENDTPYEVFLAKFQQGTLDWSHRYFACQQGQ